MTYYYYKDHKEDYGPLLKLLYWRGRQQSAVFDCFQQLCMRDFIQAGNVSLPMDIISSTTSVINLAWLLQCFEGPSQVYDSNRETTVELEGYEFDLPLRWLATMIVRSSADINGLLENILAMKYLGNLTRRPWPNTKRIAYRNHSNAIPKHRLVSLISPTSSDFGYHMEYEQHPQNKWRMI